MKAGGNLYLRSMASRKQYSTEHAIKKVGRKYLHLDGYRGNKVIIKTLKAGYTQYYATKEEAEAGLKRYWALRDIDDFSRNVKPLKIPTETLSAILNMVASDACDRPEVCDHKQKRAFDWLEELR